MIVATRRDSGRDAADDERHERTPEERRREVGADEGHEDDHPDDQDDQGRDATDLPGGRGDTTDTIGLELADAALVILGGVVQRLDRGAVVSRQPVRSTVRRFVRPRSCGCGDGDRSRLGRRGTDLLLGDDDAVGVAGGAGRGCGFVDRPPGSRDVASLDEAGDDVPDVLLDGRFDGVERVPGRLDGGAGVRDGVGVCHLVSPVVWAGPGGPL